MAGTSGGSAPPPWASTLPGRLGAGAPSARSIRGIAAVNGPGLIRMWLHWSAPGPHGIRNRWSSVGTSGHGRHARIPGHSTYTPRTREAGASRRRVRTPWCSCRGPPAPCQPASACRGRASPGAGPHSAVKLVAIAARSRVGSSWSAVPQRGLGIGRQRSSTDNKRSVPMPAEL
jgi:hypothetical protein